MTNLEKMITKGEIEQLIIDLIDSDKCFCCPMPSWYCEAMNEGQIVPFPCAELVKMWLNREYQENDND